MSTVTFTGLASGFDVQSLITQLVKAAKSPETAINQHVSDDHSQLSILADLGTKLGSLKTLTDGLSHPSEARVLAATSNAPDQVSVAVSGAAVPATYAVHVNQLAEAQSNQSNTFASDAAGIAGTGSLDITVGSGAASTISWDSTNSLSDIASKINDAGAGVSASVLYDGATYRLMINGDHTGAANTVTFGESGDALGLNTSTSQLTGAQDSKITLNNNIVITRPTNVLSDVVPGVTFTLNAVTSATAADARVSVANDTSGMLAKVQAMVTAYNSVATALSTQLSYNGVTKGGDTLFGDSSLQSLERQLGSALSASYAHGANGTSAGELGISLGADGQLTVDVTKFTAAASADPSAVQDLLAGATHGTGLSAALGAIVDQYTAPATGVIASKSDAINQSIKDYQKQVTQIETRATSLQTQLTTEYANLDKVMASLNSQMSFIQSAFYSTPKTS